MPLEVERIKLRPHIATDIFHMNPFSANFPLDCNKQTSWNTCIFKHNVFLPIMMKEEVYIYVTKTQYNIINHMMSR